MSAQDSGVRVVFSLGSQSAPGWEGLLDSLLVVTLLGIIWYHTSILAIVGILAAVAVHELGHLLAVTLSDITITKIWVSPCGVSIDYSARGVSDEDELAVAVAGAAVSCAAAVGFVIAYLMTGQSTSLLLIWSVSFMIVGVIVPIEGDDGTVLRHNWNSIRHR